MSRAVRRELFSTLERLEKANKVLKKILVKGNPETVMDLLNARIVPLQLENVYLAAKEALDCDAYCVPIPYYDKNSDGNFREMHYEGSEYPDDIEVIDWQTYNFEERKPDAIYIHNPYDECNYVTSVHLRFYATNLT